VQWAYKKNINIHIKEIACPKEQIRLQTFYDKDIQDILFCYGWEFKCIFFTGINNYNKIIIYVYRLTRITSAGELILYYARPTS